MRIGFQWIFTLLGKRAVSGTYRTLGTKCGRDVALSDLPEASAREVEQKNPTYAPIANCTTPRCFNFNLNDGRAGEITLTVNEIITIAPVNGAPAALPDGCISVGDTDLVVVASGMAANTSDIDADSLTARRVSRPCQSGCRRGLGFVYRDSLNFDHSYRPAHLGGYGQSLHGWCLPHCHIAAQWTVPAAGGFRSCLDGGG